MKIKAQIDRMVGENNRIKAYASVILGGEYVVRDIAVMDSKNGLFARMPYRSYKDRNGDMKYSDTVFAMNETSRNAINAAVLAAYEQRLHMRDRSGEQIKENPEEMEALIGLIAKQVNIDKEAARFFYLEMWAYTHGIASMIATGFYEWDEQLASRALTDVYEGLKHRYKNGGVRND